MLLPLSRVKQLCVLAGVMALTAAAHATGISATATINGVLVSPGVYDYSITLNNTGTTTIGTFWFSWIPGAGFLSATPTSVDSPTGWSDAITNGGKSIQWTSTTAWLAAGWSLSGFSFDSTETPAELMLNFTGSGLGSGDPVLTSTVYAGAPFSTPDAIFAATETPEPSSIVFMLTGLGLAAASFKSRLLRRA